MIFVATAYAPGCGDSGEGTYTGIRPHEGVIAVDRHVVPLHSRLLINGKLFVAEDTGSDIRGRRIDIWMPTCRKALTFGRRIVTVHLSPLFRKSTHPCLKSTARDLNRSGTSLASSFISAHTRDGSRRWDDVKPGTRRSQELVPSSSRPQAMSSPKRSSARYSWLSTISRFFPRCAYFGRQAPLPMLTTSLPTTAVFKLSARRRPLMSRCSF